MRHVRLIQAVVRARFRAPLAVDGESQVAFRIWPTDVDVSIANHAALLTVMEAGRIDLMVRSGFFRAARRHGWYFPLRNLRVRYRRPLRVFQKAELTTRVHQAGDDGICVRHVIRRAGKEVAVALAEGPIRQGREPVPLDRIAAELGIREWPHLPEDPDDPIG